MAITIIKIGGSVLTRKKSLRPVFLHKVVEQLVSELERYRKNINEQFIIVYGAGSFGHRLARKYGFDKPHLHKSSRGIPEIRNRVEVLNALVVKSFRKAGCPVIPLSPFFFIKQKMGRIQKLEIGVIKRILGKNLIPVLHGDVVPDSQWKFSVCSGDQIVSYLARALRPQRVLFLTDVNGIAKENPKIARTPHFFKTISKKRALKLISANPKNSEFDITGAMEGKIKEIAKIPCRVQVFNGLKKGNLLAVLHGKRRGTFVV